MVCSFRLGSGLASPETVDGQVVLVLLEIAIGVVILMAILKRLFGRPNMTLLLVTVFMIKFFLLFCMVACPE